ncbi:MAG: citrate lyase holo-[Oscillospiraceae bacterium]|nr:citrate lyase holo-[acyl-carrier protein] synthase [Oscillospiraceae bacterium]
MREVTLSEVLAAREQRVEEQWKLLKQYERPVLSFTMNIPGPVKDSALIRRGFEEGLRLLDSALKDAEIPVLSCTEIREVTGCEWLGALDAAAAKLKSICVGIEEGHPIGRLFDLDVIDVDGRKLERSVERRCFVCGAAGRSCASRRLHTLEELSAAVRKLLRDGLLQADAERIDELATAALLEELETTPKPGLVDRSNNGSHRDMTPELFRRSARALRGTWREFFLTGAETAAMPAADAFALLRAMGRDAEQKMLNATDGVNTHKGAVFTLGTVCAAIGRLWSPEDPCRDPERIAAECAALCSQAVEEDFRLLRQRGEACSAGERLYLESGHRGVRGELADGLPAVLETSLPALEAALGMGKSRNDAGVYALLQLIARGGDTNMIKRGGMKLAEDAAAEIRASLEADPYPVLGLVEEWDRQFIWRNLSPGGCADLLAVSYFLLDWSRQ